MHSHNNSQYARAVIAERVERAGKRAQAVRPQHPPQAGKRAATRRLQAIRARRAI